MQAVVVSPPSPGAQIASVEAPAASDAQVGVRVLECGICGTDRDISRGQYGSPPAGRTRLILGHENLGAVDSIGRDVVGWTQGDLVVATVRRGCGRCRFCLTDQSDFCETGSFTERGIRGADGFLAERYVELPEYLVKVPADLRRVAVLLEPLSVVEKAVHEAIAVLDRRGVTPGHPATGPVKALVAGTGAIGMLASFLLRALGWEVTAIDRHDGGTPAGQLLDRIGAHHASVAEDWSEVGSAPFDVIVEASGSAALDIDLVGHLGPNGVLVLTGIPTAAQIPISFPAGVLLRNLVLENLAIVGSVNANRRYFESGLADLATFRQHWGDAIDGVISERRPWEEAPALLADGGTAGMKSVVSLPPG
jgi:glucose 1-dehydrogenase